MPQDLPGFYFDTEKNRYFPVKGPVPGTSRRSASTSSTAKKQELKPKLQCRKTGLKTGNLLQLREFCGNAISFSKRRCSFKDEYRKIQASQPMVWKYHGTERIGDSALEVMHVDMDMPQGLTGINVLLAGCANGSLIFYEVGDVDREVNYEAPCKADCVRSLSWEKREELAEKPLKLSRIPGVALNMSSNVSCVMMSGKHSNTEAPDVQNILMTTLGSESYGGCVYILNLSEPLNYNLTIPRVRRRLRTVTSFDCTVWTADCSSNGRRAMVGTNLGAAMVDLETGTPSWVLRCKSDVFALQLDYSGQVALCGLRNGAIVKVDARQRSDGISARLTRHRIPHPSCEASKQSNSSTRNLTKRWFEMKGSVFLSDTISMPSSISCLAPLRLDDLYFLSSSMDGSIRLYDHRLMQRGPVQVYEGNVNSHTRLQLGVDPYETMFMSGGEDCNLRLWSIKSGELLFEDKFMNSIPSVVCWPRELHNKERNRGAKVYGEDYGTGTWIGSNEGLHYMRWPWP